MSAEHRPNAPSRTGEIPPKTTSLTSIVFEYLCSEDFSKYSNGTSVVYENNLNRFLRYGRKRKAIGVDEYLDTLSAYGDMRKTKTAFRKDVSAFSGFFSWAYKNNRVDAQQYEKFERWQGRQIKERFSVDARKQPLTNLELAKLTNAAGENLRDKALIYTILAARPNSAEELKHIKTSDLTTDSEGITTLKVIGASLVIPKNIAETLNAYKATVKSAPLFPSYPSKVDSGPLSRQRVHQILKYLSERAGFEQTANVSVLIKTAIRIQNDHKKKAELKTHFPHNPEP